MEETSWYKDSNCEACRIPFRAKRQEKWGAVRRFCSRDCQRKHMSADVFFTCKECGGSITIKRGKLHLDRGENKRQYCSKSCLHRAWDRDGKPDKRTFEGKIHVSSSGYIYEHAPNHPATQGKEYKYIGQHRLVMERHLGRELVKGESVHHKNGVRTDNTLSNLELWSRSQPAGQRVDDLQNENAKLRAEIAELQLTKGN